MNVLDYFFSRVQGLISISLLSVMQSCGVYSKNEYIVDEVFCDDNQLRLTLTSESYFGNHHESCQLYWNDQLVDLLGSKYKMVGEDENAIKEIPVHPEDKSSLVLRYLNQVPNENGWVIWVDPDKFSKDQYEKIQKCLQSNQVSLNEKYEQIVKGNDKFIYMKPLLGSSPLYRVFPIQAIVYGNYAKLKKRVFVRAVEDKTQTIEIEIGGEVNYSLKRRDNHGLGGTIGRLNATADTLTIKPLNKQFKLEQAELKEFANSDGKYLTDIYKIVMQNN